MDIYLHHVTLNTSINVNTAFDYLQHSRMIFLKILRKLEIKGNFHSIMKNN